MGEYLVVLRQSGGCDYTIGCGIQVDVIEADSMEDAILQTVGQQDVSEEDMRNFIEDFANEDDDDNYDDDDECESSSLFGSYGTPYNIKECGIHTIEIHEIANSVDISCEECREKIDKFEAFKRQYKMEKKEKAELARLQKKYNKK